MSIKVMSRVWESSHMKGSELLLLLAIADFANDEGKAWPKVSTLAHKTRMSERQTQRLIQSAETAGELIVHKNKGKNGTNLYVIVSPRQDVTPSQVSPGGDMDDTPGGDIVVSPEPSVYPSQESSKRRSAKPNSPAAEIVEVWAETCNAGKWPVNRGKAIGQAKLLADGGVTPADARELIGWLKGQRWIQGAIDLGLMVSQVDKWQAARETAPNPDHPDYQTKAYADKFRIPWDKRTNAQRGGVF